MTHISAAVRLLLWELSQRMDHAEALPDLAVSLLQSYLDDGEIPEQVVINNIEHMIRQDGFPQDKKKEIMSLLKKQV